MLDGVSTGTTHTLRRSLGGAVKRRGDVRLHNLVNRVVAKGKRDKDRRSFQIARASTHVNCVWKDSASTTD